METIQNLTGPCAIMQPYINPEAHNKPNVLNPLYQKLLFKSLNMYDLIPIGHTTHIFTDKENFAENEK